MRQDHKANSAQESHSLPCLSHCVTVAVIQKCVNKVKNYEVSNKKRCPQSPLIKL